MAPRPRRILLGAFGDPGHAFPVLALGEALVARGHHVAVQTWERWRAPAEAAGMTFLRAPEYPVWPGTGSALTPYAAAVRAARETVPAARGTGAEVVVSDILTLAPALAGELCGLPVATLTPHLHPWHAPGHPPFAFGARLPRTRAGAALWRTTDPLVARGLDRGRDEYNDARAQLGLPPRPGHHTALSRSLTLVATLPHLEYPRAWPDWVRVVGPLLWEPPGAPAGAPPPGDAPVVLIAPSTAQDPGQVMLRAALRGLADAPVRVLAATNDRDPGVPVPPNARLAPWISYARTMPACDVVVSHGGHGTLARALVSGCAVVVCPAAGDMAENAARADWAGVGVRLPRRLLGPGTLRLAVERVLADPARRRRARAIAAWAAAHDPPGLAAREVEAWAARVAP